MTTTIEEPECKAALHLSFVRLKIPRLIPIKLIESVKGRTFSPEAFYAYQEDQVQNPNNLLYALVDTGKKIHGFLWAEVNLLDRSLFVNTFSMAKEYWGKGRGIPLAIMFLGEQKKKLKCPKVFWLTSNSKFFQKHGFTRSKNVLMEYNIE